MREIGRIFTPYGTKFGVPKQPGLVKKDASFIELSEEFSLESVRGMIEGMFIWVLFDFHQCEGKHKELVRPPKLGGNEKMGVFATRSPFRPNNIGLSLVKLVEISKKEGKVVLKVQGADMVSGTPVLDIKPYHTRADAPWEKQPAAWYEGAADLKKVVFVDSVKLEEGFKQLVEETLALDPRPAYHEDSDRVYMNELNKHKVYWKASGDSLEVFKVEVMDD